MAYLPRATGLSTAAHPHRASEGEKGIAVTFRTFVRPFVRELRPWVAFASRLGLREALELISWQGCEDDYEGNDCDVYHVEIGQAGRRETGSHTPEPVGNIAEPHAGQ